MKLKGINESSDERKRNKQNKGNDGMTKTENK